MGNCTSSGGGSGGGGATAQQQSVMNKISQKFPVGASGINKFGGQGSTITEAPTFTRNPDGSYDYRVVGQTTIPARKYSTIGVGDTPAKRVTTISTGRINPDGSRVSYTNKSSEVSTKKDL